MNGRLVFLSVSLLLTACGNSDSSRKLTTKLSALDLQEFQACVQDSDCIYANNGCCDCANGGEETAINRSQLTAFQAQFNCTNVACTAIAKIPACGTGSVQCLNNLCTFIP